MATGFTPAQFNLVQGQQYTVTVSDYRNYVFERWQDSGSTVRARTISITQNTAVVALYRQPDLVLTPASGLPGTTVTASPRGGTYSSAQSISLAANEPATIYYTTDGTDPTASPTRSTYSAPITISSSTTLCFYGIDLAGNPGSVTNENYAIQPQQATVHMQDTTATFSHVNPANQPPVANNRSATTAENTPVSIVLTGSDHEGQPVRFYIASPPTKGFLGMINPATGTVTYTPYDYRDGPDSFTYMVSDGSLDSTPATVSISIANTATDATSEAVVISIKTTNRSVTGLWTTLAQNGQTINSGGTHIAFDVNNNQQYTVTATDYGTNFFDHWQDTGSTSRSRTISIAKDAPLVAVYC